MSWKEDKNGDLAWVDDDDVPWSDHGPYDPNDPFDPRSMKGTQMASTAMSVIDGGKKSSSKDSGKWLPRCYESHPPYPVTDELVIYGGSCGYPIVKDADVYIGFDGSMKLHGKSYPWHAETGGPIEVYFKIWDGDAPDDKPEFKLMIAWVAEQLLAGKKVHAGCIGGHGRTGMFLAALRKHMTGDENATQHVRDHYCKKAVESTKQVDFLFKDWGIAKVAPSKSYGTSKSSSKGGQGKLEFKEFSSGGSYSSFDKKPAHKTTGNPLNTAASIWGDG
jgi:hypothetical protein